MEKYINIKNINYHEKENMTPIVYTCLMPTDGYRGIDGYIYETYKCNNCGKKISSCDIDEEFNFCPKCGAKIIR